MKNDKLLTANMTDNSTEDCFSTPIDIFDILNVCRSYSQLGYNIQSQVECIVEIGIEEAVKANIVSVPAIPHIKNFLQQIVNNSLFGDAASQANDLIEMIDIYQITHGQLFKSQVN